MSGYKEIMMINNIKTCYEAGSSDRVGNDEAEAYLVRLGTVGFASLTLETLSTQDLAEPVACCHSSQERSKKYLNGDLSLQDIMDIVVHLNECPLCSRQREIEGTIRSTIKRYCQKEQAPDSLKTKIVVQISMLTEELN